MAWTPNHPRSIAHRPGPGRLGHLACRACGQKHTLGDRAVSLHEWVYELETFAREHECAAASTATPEPAP